MLPGRRRLPSATVTMVPGFPGAVPARRAPPSEISRMRQANASLPTCTMAASPVGSRSEARRRGCSTHTMQAMRQDEDVVPAPEQAQRAGVAQLVAVLEHERPDHAGDGEREVDEEHPQQRPLHETLAAVAALGGDAEFVTLRLEEPVRHGLDDLRGGEQLRHVGHDRHHAALRHPAHDGDLGHEVRQVVGQRLGDVGLHGVHVEEPIEDGNDDAEQAEGIVGGPVEEGLDQADAVDEASGRCAGARDRADRGRSAQSPAPSGSSA